MIDRQEARSDVARIDPAADRWLHTANRARATTDPRAEFWQKMKLKQVFATKNTEYLNI
jgi:hypothetical protein